MASGRECLFHFPGWMIHRGDVTYVVCVQKQNQILCREVSGGIRAVASWSQCEGGQYLKSYVILGLSLMLQSEHIVSYLCWYC